MHGGSWIEKCRTRFDGDLIPENVQEAACNIRFGTCAKNLRVLV